MKPGSLVIGLLREVYPALRLDFHALVESFQTLGDAFTP